VILYPGIFQRIGHYALCVAPCHSLFYPTVCIFLDLSITLRYEQRNGLAG
jgi:hypothetical protein